MDGTKWLGMGLVLAVGTLGVWAHQSPTAPPLGAEQSGVRSTIASFYALAASGLQRSRPLHIPGAPVPSEGALEAVSATTAPESAPAHSPSGGPALTVSADTLEKALFCPSSFSPAHQPVLLVHGIAHTPDEDWSWNYAKVLPTQGFDICTVALPDLAREDLQVQTEYIVHAIMAMGQRAGSKVDVIGFSIPALATRAAMKWWPDARGLVDDLVLIGVQNHGEVNFEVFCAVRCIAPFWQTKPGSKFLAALNARDETPGDVSYTSLYSRTDPTLQPALVGMATSDLAGASNIAIQDLCPGRFVDHPQALYDAAFYAVAIDALTHPGPAEAPRIDKSVCTQLVMPGVEPAEATTMHLGWWRDIMVRGQEHQTDEEPAPAPWAVP